MFSFMERLFCSDFRYELTKRYHKMKIVQNENVLRIALLVFSICFGLLSISLIVLGIVYINELEWPRHYIGLDFVELPTLIIILGSLSFLLAIVGCLCAKSYNKPFYILFCICLIVILALELTIAVIAFQNDTETRRLNTKILMQEQLKNNGSEVFFSAIEEHFQCCGVDGTEPKCVQKNNSALSVEGCVNKVNEYLDGVCHRTEYLAAVIAFLQFMQILCVIAIIFTINN